MLLPIVGRLWIGDRNHDRLLLNDVMNHLACVAVVTARIMEHPCVVRIIPGARMRCSSQVQVCCEINCTNTRRCACSRMRVSVISDTVWSYGYRGACLIHDLADAAAASQKAAGWGVAGCNVMRSCIQACGAKTCFSRSVERDGGTQRSRTARPVVENHAARRSEP